MINHKDRLLEQDMSEVFNIESPPNLIEATLARVNEPLDNKPAPMIGVATIKPTMGIRWLTAAAVILAVSLSAFVIYQPSSTASNSGAMTISHNEEVPKPTDIDESVTQKEPEVFEKPAKEWAVSQKWEGADSAIKKREIRVVKDGKAWLKLWEDHKPARDKFILPTVDFKKNLVLAVFGGDSTNTKGFYVDSILQKPYGSIGYVVRLGEHELQNGRAPIKATPYGFWVLPNQVGFIVEENVGWLLWNTIHRYDGRIAAMSDHQQAPKLEHTVVSTTIRKQAVALPPEVITNKSELLDFLTRAFGTGLNGQTIVSKHKFDFRTQWVYAATYRGGAAVSTNVYAYDKNTVHVRHNLQLSKVGGSISYVLLAFTRDSRNWIIETPVKDRLNMENHFCNMENHFWQEGKAFSTKQQFGTIKQTTTNSCKHESEDYYLVKDSNTLANLAEIAGVELEDNFANFENEMVLVIFSGGKMFIEGITLQFDGDKKITYKMHARGGVETGLHAQCGFFVLPKHDKPIMLHKSYTIGKSKPTVSKVKHFK